MALMRATNLLRLPVIDVNSAEQIGLVDEIILDCAANRLAGLKVRSERGMLQFVGSRLLPVSVVTVGASCCRGS